MIKIHIMIKIWLKYGKNLYNVGGSSYDQNSHNVGSSYDQNSCNDQVMIKILTLIETLSKSIQTRTITIFKDQKNLIGIEFHDEINL